MLKKIAVFDSQIYRYPNIDTLFRPDTKYPEYRMGDVSHERNGVYKAVREGFHLLGLDKENYGQSTWNPLGAYISPGDNVLIKPNLVMDKNLNKYGETDCLYTHPAVVAAVVDYALIALQGEGKIVIGDAPMQECNFENLKKNSGYGRLVNYYCEKGYPVTMVDFREMSSVVKNGVHHSSIRHNVKGKIVQLGKDSDFYKMPNQQHDKIRVTNYDPRILPTHHCGEKHEYYISDYVLDADVIINMPKPKTHRKAGVTISLKNFVGANVRKEYLPHHTVGSVEENGDEYLKKNKIHSFQSQLMDKRNIYSAEGHYIRAYMIRYLIKICVWLLSLSNDKFAEGSWYGNHTISKTINDINKIIAYADKQGVMKESRQRKLLIVADMIISGEKEAPVNPTPKNVGIIAMGDDQLLFDEAIATLMGFDINKIPTFEGIRKWKGKYKIYSGEDTSIFVSNNKMYDGKTPKELKYEERFNYEASSGWKGHIELLK